MRERTFTCRIAAAFVALALPVFSSCDATNEQLEVAQVNLDVAQLKAELKNPAYCWNGPTSHEDRIPVLHAARALACIGDDAVPVLIDAAEDSDIDIISIYDALSEIGIPVHEFHDDVMDRRMDAVENWWRKNAESTRSERSKYRVSIGLPPLR